MAKEKEISDFNLYKNNIEFQKEEINKKISNLEQKLLSLQNKESIINSLINKINLEMESIDPKHFKAISQMRTTLNKQFETLSLIMDMIIKVEDMIQKYRKMIIDIENKKIDNFIKLNKETENDEADFNALIETLNKSLNTSTNNNPMLLEAAAELENSGY